MTKTYQVERHAPVTGAQIEALREAVGWDRMAGMYDLILSRSYTHFSVRDNIQLVGFVNVISDGIGDAFLVDLMIHPDFQRRGIGQALVKQAAAELKADGLRFIQVTFEPELESFYRACGFHHMTRAGLIDTGV
jgi:ribosomal protein S18 acetylase RimI-like enzyme